MNAYACGNFSKRKLCEIACKTCYSRSFASVVLNKCLSGKKGPKTTIIPSEFWDVELNGDVLPHQVSKNQNRLYFFKYKGHAFSTRLVDCTQRGNWCPYIAGKKLCDDEICKTCTERSAASLPNIKDWNYEANDNVEPRTIMKYSHSKYWFTCKVCKHDYQTKLDNAMKGDGCSYCNGDNLCEMSNNPKIHFDGCKFCWNNSFASQKQAKFWSERNDIFPRFVRKYSSKKFWFTCNNPKNNPLGCKHEFESALSNISVHDNWCPYCSEPPKKLCDDIKCKSCFERSFASSDKAKCISVSNNPPIDPRKLFKNAHVKVTFTCDDDLCKRDFDMMLNNVSQGQWCPRHQNKTEKKFYEWLEDNFPSVAVVKEWRECKNPSTKKHLPFDFYIKEYNLIIEIDGPQHFVQVSNWKSPEETRVVDNLKEKWAKSKGITIIRFLQEDILTDRNNWFNLAKIYIKMYEVAKPKLIKIYRGTAIIYNY